MLNRAIAPSSTTGVWTEWRRGLTTRQSQLLFRYVVVVAVLCILGCVYLAQMNVITNLISNTHALDQKAIELEATNAMLMQKLSQTRLPEAIAAQAEARHFETAGALGMVTVSQQPASPTTQVETTISVAQVTEAKNRIR